MSYWLSAAKQADNIDRARRHGEGYVYGTDLPQTRLYRDAGTLNEVAIRSSQELGLPATTDFRSLAKIHRQSLLTPEHPDYNLVYSNPLDWTGDVKAQMKTVRDFASAVKGAVIKPIQALNNLLNNVPLPR